MAKKRKHDEAVMESSGGKERQKKAKDSAPPQVVSSNWMQLQAVGVPDPSR